MGGVLPSSAQGGRGPYAKLHDFARGPILGSNPFAPRGFSAVPEVWYYAKDDEQQGPISTQDLRQLATNGKLTPDDYVWKEGMEEWTPASQLKGLFPEIALPVQRTPSDPLLDIAAAEPVRPRSKAPSGARVSGRTLWKVQVALWTVCILTVLASSVVFARAWLRAQTPEEKVAAGVLFAVFFVGPYVIARSGEKVADLMVMWSAHAKDKDRH